MKKDFNIKTKQAINYFQNFTQTDNESSQKEVQLDINLINAKANNIYGIKLVNCDKPSNDNTLNSKMIKCTNQNKIQLLKYICDYIFGKQQKINLELIVKSSQNSDLETYPIFTSIGEIVGSENSTKYFNFSDTEEKIEVRAQSKKTRMKYLTIHFLIKVSSQNDKVEEEYFKNAEYKLYFKIGVNNNKTIIYESEAFTDDGKFNIVQIPLWILKSNFSILFFNHKNQNIGTIDTSINELSDSSKKNKIIFQKRLSLNAALNIFNYSSIKDEITFLDYIKNGVRIALDIGIDFTGSNGDPDDEDTLHCRLPNMKKRNPYERAILSCANIMANYDFDQLFPVYGFGAVIKGHKNPSMCFNINFQEDPNIQFVDNIMKEYYAVLDKIYFSGPTCFAPIINKIISQIKEENDVLEYHVLMILTDGKIDDFEDTVDALVEGSFLPLSVIIVGIGDNPDFNYMIELDGDDKPLVSRNGKKRQRDLVQFVPFNKFEDDEKKLTEEVLDEIPRQVIEYYTLNFLYPDTIKGNNNEKQPEEPKIPQNIQSSRIKESTQIFKDPEFSPFNNVRNFSGINNIAQYTNDGNNLNPNFNISQNQNANNNSNNRSTNNNLNISSNPYRNNYKMNNYQ